MSICPQSRARKKLTYKTQFFKGHVDPLYAEYVSLRSERFSDFLNSRRPARWQLPITSVNEDLLLAALGLPVAERNRIEGLQTWHNAAPGVSGRLTEEQRMNRAIVKLAADPPKEVGRMQTLTTKKLLRPL